MESGKFNVEFDFAPGQKVKTCFGDVGTVDMCGMDRYVLRNQDSRWFRFDEIEPVA